MTDVQRDRAEIKRLRNYYRRNFANGGSDQAFLLWLETHLFPALYTDPQSAIPNPQSAIQEP